MAIDFPASPAANEIYEENDLSWQWNGTSWDALVDAYTAPPISLVAADITDAGAAGIEVIKAAGVLEIQVAAQIQGASGLISLAGGAIRMRSANLIIWSNSTNPDGGSVLGLKKLSDGVLQITEGYSGVGSLDCADIDASGVVSAGSFTVATVPAASSYAGGQIYVTDETGGAVTAFSDGTNWRRSTDRAVIS